jgi:fumarate reductase subunit C
MSGFFNSGLRVFWFLLAIVCFAYAGIVFAAGSGTASFTIWIAIALIFSFFFFLAGGERWSNLNLILKALNVAISIIGLIIFGLGQFLILKWFNAKPADNLDYIIVLGAQMKEDGPSTVYKYRLDAAFNYLYDNKKQSLEQSKHPL